MRAVAGKNILVVDDNPTILHVVELVLTRSGYTVRSAGDGDEAMERCREERPDLILLDFVMPKMNGYQFCRELAADPGLQGVPVVLMSGKADEVGDRFVKLMGIVDYLGKPFSREALQAVVEHALSGKATSPGASPTLEVDIDVVPVAGTSPHDEQTSPRHRLPVFPSERKLDAIAALRESIVETCIDCGVVSMHDAQSLRAVLSDGELERAVTPVAQALLFHSDVALDGNIRKVPIGEVLALLAEQRQWGVLTVMRELERPAGEAARVDISFKQGKIELVLADRLSSEFQVGRYLAAAHEISDEEIGRALEPDGGAAARPLGARLVELDRIKQADVNAALGKQARERIYELLRWPAGRFSFVQTRELAPLAVDAALGLSVGEVLMEGFRRVDEWYLIEREVDDFDAVFLRNEELLQDLGRAKLERDELIVLDLVNGRNSVSDIVRRSRFSSYDVAKLLYRLLATKLIRRRIAPVVA